MSAVDRERSEPAEPIIGPTAKFAGLLCTQGSARIDGAVAGEIVSRGRILIGETGRVRARIEVDELVVAGELQGEVWARERIELAPTARVAADLHAPRLVLAEGCVLEGRCHTERPDPEAARQPVTARGSP